MVYFRNEVTKKFNGVIIQKFWARKRWVLGNTTLSQGLPIDLIRFFYEPVGKDVKVTFNFQRLQKVSTNPTEDQPLILWDKKTTFSHSENFDCEQNCTKHLYVQKRKFLSKHPKKKQNKISAVYWKFWSLLQDVLTHKAIAPVFPFEDKLQELTKELVL